jgi:regulator of protease activity HflC (stomatin/prohibitin superfamily)
MTFYVTNSLFTTIPEGYVGVWKYLGQIQPQLVTGPIFYNPILSTIELVKYIEDHDKITNVKCVSKEGVDLIISEVIISNKIHIDSVLDTTKAYGVDTYDKLLVIDPVSQKIRELCAERTVDQIEITDYHLLDDLVKKEIQAQNNALKTGITIPWVRFGIIIVPKEIKEKRLALASEKANKILTEETMKRKKLEKDHEMDISKKDSEIRIQKAENNNKEMLINIQAEREKKSVENLMIIEAASANAKKIMMEAEALASMYGIPGYTDLKKAEALSTNTKYFWGPELPGIAVIGTNNQVLPHM